MADDFPIDGQGATQSDGLDAANALALVYRPDFQLGEATIRPSIRTVEGPGGLATAEPRVMQVLLALADADGAVLSREDLLRLCWQGRIVGDDAVNRTIAAVRRIASETQAGFGVETIPRIGYRLNGKVASIEAVATKAPPEEHARSAPTPEKNGILIARRLWLGGGLATLAAAGGGLWLAAGRKGPSSAAHQIEEGRRILREMWPDQEARGVDILREAVAIEPENAEAWGMLAVAWRNVAEGAPPDKTRAAVAGCEDAARRALALDPREGNALAALATLHPYLGDWQAAEDRMRKVLEVAPDNPNALMHLVALLQSVGYARASWDLNERAMAREPLSPIHMFRKALKFWIFGRVPDADLTIDRALRLWPRHPAIWNARLYIFAFTDRADAALAMIGDHSLRPAKVTPQLEERWRVALTALRTRASGDIAIARHALAEAVSPSFAVQAILILSSLGELDAAFAVAEGFLLRKGPLVGSLWPPEGEMIAPDERWRRTMNLFTPATAPMRADPRFAALCDGLGLTRYWRVRGVGPDAFLMRDQKRASTPIPNSRGSPAVASPVDGANL